LCKRIEGFLVSAHLEKNYSLIIPRIRVV
jgi:hypothetical protein